MARHPSIRQSLFQCVGESLASACANPQHPHDRGACHVPLHVLVCPTPPEETLPIADFRVRGSRHVGKPSGNLLDTLYQHQRRQHWYQDYAVSIGAPDVVVVGSLTLETPIAQAAEAMRRDLNYDLRKQKQAKTWEGVLRDIGNHADDLGILVMKNSMVGSNTHRRLDREEFSGFALCDKKAPLIFINNADYKAARNFTIVHELAHIWLGEAGLSHGTLLQHERQSSQRIEAWCNKVTAEFLVPEQDIKGEPIPRDVLEQAIEDLSWEYKVSTWVILLRILHVGRITSAVYHEILEKERKPKVPSDEQKQQGAPPFHVTLLSRLGRRFRRALIGDTLGGHTLYRDAYAMLGTSKHGTFLKLSEKLGA
ncbi:MAG: ImmA/IrrE family metallo-endopeptidase [Alphaproteobacteria bacterium GM7ARS4]|nr:ImmA/IrrE family metallo-endopeptidase [Alphaproteobacteria bacterium GM7ARS4]